MKWENNFQVNDYLQEDPFRARQTPENEIAYERLMDVRLKLYVSSTTEYSNTL